MRELKLIDVTKPVRTIGEHYPVELSAIHVDVKDRTAFVGDFPIEGNIISPDGERTFASWKPDGQVYSNSPDYPDNIENYDPDAEKKDQSSLMLESQFVIKIEYDNNLLYEGPLLFNTKPLNSIQANIDKKLEAAYAKAGKFTAV